MDVSVIIVSYNVAQFLNLCLDSVTKALQHVKGEVIVVDNNSSDSSLTIVQQHYPSVKIIANSENLGFSKANNQASKVAQGKYIHYLNPDTILSDDFYLKSINFLNQHQNIGCLGPKILDADGKYAFDSKKSFPSFKVSVFKLLGLSKLFPNSKVFNAYYSAHVDEDEIATVDILSGCCLLVRKEALDKIGGGFDEQYFMYCEDVDMCHSIQLQGYDNIYFPEVSIVHFKGESTKKLTVSYMKIFYEAHALFIKKYYPPRLGKLYNFGLSVVLGLRNIWTIIKHIFSIFKLYIIDAVVLFVSLYTFTAYWHNEIVSFTGNVKALDFVQTIPLYILIWILSLFLNGAYDKPYSLFRAGRGMVIGSIVVLAVYGLMPLEYRFSRGVVLFNALLNTVLLLLVRVVLNALKVITLVPRGKYNYKSAIVSDFQYQAIKEKLESQKHPIDILGRIGVTDNTNTIGQLENIVLLQKAYGLHEIIIDLNSISFKDLLGYMSLLNGKVHFKFINRSLGYEVSSDMKKSYPLYYAIENVYNLGMPNYRRNKRLLDLVISIVALLTLPINIWLVKDKNYFIRNIFSVLVNKKTWIGYKQEWGISLPMLKTPVYTIADAYINQSNSEMLYHLSKLYALKYNVTDDIIMIIKKILKK